GPGRPGPPRRGRGGIRRAAAAGDRRGGAGRRAAGHAARARRLHGLARRGRVGGGGARRRLLPGRRAGRLAAARARRRRGGEAAAGDPGDAEHPHRRAGRRGAGGGRAGAARGPRRRGAGRGRARPRAAARRAGASDPVVGRRDTITERGTLERGTPIERAGDDDTMWTILLADDDPMQHELVEATLSRAHRVLQAWTGREALAVARQERPDLVLLDALMPELDGVEVCRQLKAEPVTRDIAVVILSARNAPLDHRRGVEAGADVYMTKPFSPSALLDTVRRTLGGDDLAQPLPAPVLAPPDGPTEKPAELVQTLAYAHELSALYEVAQERAARFRLLV